jgi:2-oxo-4-hydroxy-4-carboxy-5-ureidoimidazoline decarboxylase
MNHQSRWLADLNADDDPVGLMAALHACCASPSWIAAILAARPYLDDEALLATSDAATATLDDADLALALAAHPRIGERAASTPSAEGSWSSQEQSGMNSADADVRARIAEANTRYEQRFDQVYLVCATGLSAEQLLAICLERLDNDPVIERVVVLDELAKIARLRLGRLLHPSPEPVAQNGPS